MGKRVYRGNYWSEEIRVVKKRSIAFALDNIFTYVKKYRYLLIVGKFTYVKYVAIWKIIGPSANNFPLAVFRLVETRKTGKYNDAQRVHHYGAKNQRNGENETQYYRACFSIFTFSFALLIRWLKRNILTR